MAACNFFHMKHCLFVLTHFCTKPIILTKVHAHTQVEAKCQQVQEQAEKREQELSSQVTSLGEAGIQAENQVKELKETIFELEDQVEQQRAVNCHTNQAVLDMESMFFSLAVQFSVALWSLLTCKLECNLEFKLII